MKTLLLVDVANTAIRNLSVNKYLSYDESWTGGFYGTISELVHFISRNGQPDGIIFCNDKKPYLRDIDYPNYKGDRKKKDYHEEEAPEGWDFYKALNDTHRLLKEFCAIADYPHWEIDGYEADDLIALCVNHFVPSFDNIYILSNDSDLNQLLENDKILIWKKVGKGKKLYGRSEFKQDFNIDPSQWPFYTAMVGTHNGVPGIKGIGKVTAPKIINDDVLTDRVISKYEKELAQKLDLIELPYWKINPEAVVFPDPEKGTHSFRKIMVFLEQQGIDVTSSYREAFE